MPRRPEALILGALLALAAPSGAPGHGEGGPKLSTTGKGKGGAEGEPVAPKTHARLDQELAKGGKDLGGRFWADVGGWEPGEGRRGAELLAAYFEGPAAFRRAILSGGLGPGALKRLLARLRPYLLDVDPATGRRERPSRGPPADVWEELTRRFPREPEGHAALGDALLERKDYARAAAAYDRALGLGAGTPENFTGRGLAAERLGDFQQANRDALEAVRLDPSSPGAAALARLTQGRPSRVTLRLESGVNVAAASPASPPPSGYEAAPEPAASLPAAVGAQVSASLAREAARSFELGDLRAATLAATRALESDPGNVEAYNLRAKARDRGGDRAGAVQDATRGLSLAPGNIALLNTRSWALSGLGRFEEALADSGRALALAPDDAFSRATMARAEGGLGRRAEMAESLREAARLDRRFAPALEAAQSLPRDQDSELLFSGALAGRAPEPAVGRTGRFAFLLASILLGGALVALGLLHVLAPGLKERVTTALRRRPRSAVEGAPKGLFWEHYAFKRVVASGGMGIVYEAVDRSLSRPVAVKQMRGEIRDDPKERESFLKEARLMASLKHPGIVEAYSIVEDGPDLYLVFEFVPGMTLQALIHERGRLAVPEALGLLKDVCAAVQHAHDQGVIHRDLKPSNILVTPAGRAKVMDFGLARRTLDARGAARTTTAAGTPSYMAPEAEAGALRKESDVFSLGVCFYEMLAGRLPYQGMAGALALRKQSGKFEPASRRAPGIAPAIDVALARALAPSPQARQNSPAVLYAELARASG